MNLNFSSYQGIIYVNFNASLGPLKHPPQPVYTFPTYEKSSAKKFNQTKPSRIPRKRRREEQRHSKEEDVVNAIKHSYEVGKLSVTQRLGIVTIIPKGDKDKSFL